MRIFYSMGMMNIDSRRLSFSSLEDLYKDGGSGVDLQCNHKEDSPEYNKIKQKCKSIYILVKELEELL